MPINIIAPSKKSLADYAELRRRVWEAFAAGKSRALDAVDREKVRTSWEVGKLVQEHILLNKPRADYGTRVIKRLSKDLTMDSSELHRMVEFAREYPIFGPVRKLSWAHQKMLLGINDKVERAEITREAESQNWSKRDLRREINRRKAAKQITVSEAPREELLVPIKGKLDTYRIITAKAGPWVGKLAIDLGFANYHLPAGSLQRFQDRDIVEIASPSRPLGTRRPSGRPPLDRLASSAKKHSGLLAMTDALHIVKDATENDLFTYRAYLLKVTDGDTLWVLIDLGFGFVTQQQLRLRGLDAPEINSREGQEAKRFVEKELKNIPRLIITSTKSDKYDRYLADVFYTVDGKERFLNNRLLETGHAERA